MKLQNEPAAYGVLAGLIVVLIGVLATCSSCAGFQRHAPSPGFPRTAAEQMQSTYSVTVWCLDDKLSPLLGITRQSGSAVMTDAHHLLTALHVVQCAAGAPAITLTAMSGSHYEAYTLRQWTTKDIVELYVERALPGAPVLVGQRPRAGYQICTHFGTPAFGEACGEVLNVEPARPDSDVVHTAHTEHGNSGGGVYDGSGRLVGIVTQLIVCIPGLPLSCGGRVSSLEGVL